MGFLIRFAFWFSLVLLALPFDTGPDDYARESVNPVQTLFLPGDAAGDLVNICKDQPEICKTGVSTVHTITEQAKIIVDLARTLVEDTPKKQPETPQDPVMTGSVSTNN
ncbi:DUF5330 domain-containing protein [Aquamicrobium segne]|uniref:DUF5330 domain-containing protein n=1 Tax=Aquamicrobium segne TaxID=469547 RepID=A0ABW0GVD7_9HYPH